MEIKLNKKVKIQKSLFGVYLEDWLIEQVSKMAKEKEVSKSEMVRAILEAGLKEINHV